MEKGDEWRGDSPFGLRRFGREFIRVGCDALDAYRKSLPELGDPGTTPFRREQLLAVAPDAIYYNFLHGIELGLKSYLRHVDAVPLQALRRHPFGHDLSRLLGEAINKHNLRTACPKLTDTHIDAIHHSSPLYASKEFEYIYIGFVSLVGIDEVAEAAETLINDLCKLRMKPAQPPGQ